MARHRKPKRWIVHRILRGANAGLWLPFAASRLEALNAANPNGIFTQTYDPPGATVQVEQLPPHRYIRITSGSFYFEFLTSGNPVETQTIDALTGYRTAAVGVTLKGASASARFVGDRKVDFQQSPSLVKRMPQVNLVDEPAFARVGSNTLYESWAPNHPFTGIFARGFIGQNDWGEYNWMVTKNSGYGRGMYSAFETRDVGIDVPFQYGPGTGPVKLAYVEDTHDDPHADFPRTNAVQRVNDVRFGERFFGILVDASSQFYVFPYEEIGPTVGKNQNIPQQYLQKVRPEFPAWCFVSDRRLADIPSLDDAMVTEPDPDWKFTLDGKKACLVVLERQPAAFDSAFTKATSPTLQMHGDYSDTFQDGLGFDAVHSLGVKQRWGAGLNDTQAADYWFNCAPGLIEVTLTIALTGERPQDFVVTASLAVIRRPTTTPYCTMLAGYAWYDQKAPDFTTDNQHYLARAGDLVVLDIERWWNPELRQGTTVSAVTPIERRTIVGGAFAGGSGSPIPFTYPDAEARKPYISFMVLKNLTRAAEIQAFPSAALIDYDIPTLSFAMLERYDEWTLGSYNTWGSAAWRHTTAAFQHPNLYYDFYVGTTQGGVAYPYTVRQLVRHFAVSIWTHGAKFRELIFPEAITDPARGAITAATAVSPRDAIAALTAGYELVPLNDARDWTDADLNAFRYMNTAEIQGTVNPNPDGSILTDAFTAIGNAFAHAFFLSSFVVNYTAGSMPATLGALQAGSAPSTNGGLSSRDHVRANDALAGNPWSSGFPHYTATRATINWWQNAVWTKYGPPNFSFYVTPPWLTWTAYANELVDRMLVAPSSTFFAHPNGSWAFYSPQFIYNRNPMVLSGADTQYPGNVYDTGPTDFTPSVDPVFGGLPAYVAWKMNVPPSNREPFSSNDILARGFEVPAQVNTYETFDAALLEHCIFDRVHLASRNFAHRVDTTFRELYNQACNALAAESPERAHLQVVELTDLRAVFTKNSMTHNSWGVLAGDIVNVDTPHFISDGYAFFTPVKFDVLDLEINWQGNIYYYKEIGYFNITSPGAAGAAPYVVGPNIVDKSAVSGVDVPAMDYGGHGLIDLNMGHLFKTAAGEHPPLVMPDIDANYTKFSSCLMIDS